MCVCVCVWTFICSLLRLWVWLCIAPSGGHIYYNRYIELWGGQGEDLGHVCYECDWFFLCCFLSSKLSQLIESVSFLTATKLLNSALRSLSKNSVGYFCALAASTKQLLRLWWTTYNHTHFKRSSLTARI